MDNLFYNLVLYPLTQIIELTFSFCYKLFHNTGLSLFGVSFTVSMLTLPLYIVAEHWQEVERNKQLQMKPKVDRIKRAFKGTEQYMILSTYYKQSHYHPIMALRSAFGLLIQIPFFTAAYNCLSNMAALQGRSFWIFKDLGAPDALFSIGSFNINILPILMTAINVAAAAVYLRGLPIREKIQTYGLAAIFLVLLYDRPAGLVIYWTMNQIFSLVKNIFYRLKNPVKVLYIIMCSAITVLIVWMFASHALKLKRAVLLTLVFSLIYFVPFLVKFCNYIIDNNLKKLRDNFKFRLSVFVISASGLSILLGLVIPSMLIGSSPMEFSGIDSYGSPMFFVWNTFIQSIGLCILWPSLIYFLFKERIQTLLSFSFFGLFILSLINAFLFAENYGTLSTMLVFNEITTVDSPVSRILINLIVIAVTSLLLLFIFKIKKTNFITYSSAILAFSLVVLSGIKINTIKTDYKRFEEVSKTKDSTIGTIKPIFHFSKTGKNVLLIFLDRAQNRFIEPMFEEFPEFKQSFTGFTLYKNIVSFNSHTLMGSPGCYGGYEYTPAEMIKRPDETLAKKHNEAVTLLPRIMTEQAENYTAMITEPSWSNYSWISDLSIFDSYPKIQSHLTAGIYTSKWFKQHKELAQFNVTSDTLKRNILWYGLFRLSPLALRPAFYNQGSYWDTNKKNEDLEDYLNWYSVLDYLPELSDLNAPSENSYISIVNETTHKSIMLQQPDFVPVVNVTNIGNGKYDNNPSYNSMAGAMKKVSEYMAFLKENVIYDNTKIIIYSDHGCESFEEEFNWDEKFESIKPGRYHPLLMVKDFNQTGALKTNYDFMTNADVPTLTFEGIVKDPKNPYTGLSIDSHQKKDGALVCLSNKFMPHHFSSKNIFTVEPDSWYLVKDNIFDSKNWVQQSIQIAEEK